MTRRLRALTALLAVAAVTSCNTGGQVAPKEPLRAEQVVPVGMERYALEQVTLHIELPAATGKKNAADLTKVVAAVHATATGDPGISVGNSTDSDHGEEPEPQAEPHDTDALTATVTDVDVSLLSARDTAAVTSAVTKAVRGVKVRPTRHEALGFTVTLTATPGQDLTAPVNDAASKIIDPVLVGGYSLRRADPAAAVTLTYVGSGVTPAGLAAVKAALASAYRVPPGNVTVASVK